MPGSTNSRPSASTDVERPRTGVARRKGIRQRWAPRRPEGTPSCVLTSTSCAMRWTTARSRATAPERTSAPCSGARSASISPGIPRRDQAPASQVDRAGARRFLKGGTDIAYLRTHGVSIRNEWADANLRRREGRMAAQPGRPFPVVDRFEGAPDRIFADDPFHAEQLRQHSVALSVHFRECCRRLPRKVEPRAPAAAATRKYGLNGFVSNSNVREVARRTAASPAVLGFRPMVRTPE
jgi:hypothetical protein